MFREKFAMGMLRLCSNLDGSIERTSNDALEIYQHASLEDCLAIDAAKPNGGVGDLEPGDGLALIADLYAGDTQSAVAQISEAQPGLPIVVVAAQPSLAAATPVLRAGAYAVADASDATRIATTLIEAARAGHASRQQRQHLLDLRKRFALLTKAERQVLDAMLDGMANKQIAHALEIGLRTVELRRSKIMRKMQARSLAELIKFVCLVLPKLVAAPPTSSCPDQQHNMARV